MNPERANPRGAEQQRAWRHLVSAAKLRMVCLGVNRISMPRSIDREFGLQFYDAMILVGQMILLVDGDEEQYHL